VPYGGRRLERLSVNLGVVEATDYLAPVVAFYTPKSGEVTYIEEFIFKIFELPHDSPAELNLGSILFMVDGRTWVSKGLPNPNYCSIAASYTGSKGRVNFFVYPNEDLAHGEHEVLLQIEDSNGNRLSHEYSFQQDATHYKYGYMGDEETDLQVKKLGARCWDFKLSQSCTHRLVQELHFVDGDLLTVRLDRSIASQAELEVRVNGRLVAPAAVNGFTVQLDELSVHPFQKHKLVFKKSFRSETDLVEVTYVTNQNTCPRCHTLGYLDDLKVEPNMSPQKVSGVEKLIQESMKIVTTSLSSNFYYEWYGTHIVDFVGEKSSTITRVKEVAIKTQVSDALKVLRDLQIQTRHMLNLQDDEMLDRVTSVYVESTDADPTAFFVNIEAETLAGAVFEVHQAFYVPGLG